MIKMTGFKGLSIIAGFISLQAYANSPNKAALWNQSIGAVEEGSHQYVIPKLIKRIYDKSLSECKLDKPNVDWKSCQLVLDYENNLPEVETEQPKKIRLKATNNCTAKDVDSCKYAFLWSPSELEKKAMLIKWLTATDQVGKGSQVSALLDLVHSAQNAQIELGKDQVEKIQATLSAAKDATLASCSASTNDLSEKYNKCQQSLQLLAYLKAPAEEIAESTRLTQNAAKNWCGSPRSDKWLGCLAIEPLPAQKDTIETLQNRALIQACADDNYAQYHFACDGFINLMSQFNLAAKTVSITDRGKKLLDGIYEAKYKAIYQSTDAKLSKPQPPSDEASAAVPARWYTTELSLGSFMGGRQSPFEPKSFALSGGMAARVAFMFPGVKGGKLFCTSTGSICADIGGFGQFSIVGSNTPAAVMNLNPSLNYYEIVSLGFQTRLQIKKLSFMDLAGELRVVLANSQVASRVVQNSAGEAPKLEYANSSIPGVYIGVGPRFKITPKWFFQPLFELGYNPFGASVGLVASIGYIR